MNQMKNTEFSQRGKKDGETEEEGKWEAQGRKVGLKGRGKGDREEERETERLIDLKDLTALERGRKNIYTGWDVVADMPSCHYCATSDGVSSLEICVKFQLRTSGTSQGNIS